MISFGLLFPQMASHSQLLDQMYESIQNNLINPKMSIKHRSITYIQIFKVLFPFITSHQNGGEI